MTDVVFGSAVALAGFIVGYLLSRRPPPGWRQEYKKLQAELDAYRSGEKR